ncbi:MAG: tRNA pseudouridine(13) synthase TruD [Phycisphaera sp.]|nr:tRNA pseudouridine(13) synthase TruD [Phycisphaera sp.]
MTVTSDTLAYVTADEPGIGGRIKARTEDFVVEEVPLFTPGGEGGNGGDYLYLQVQKRKRLTSDVVRFFAEHFGVEREAIGFAGLKDKHAVVRQWFSVAGATEDRAVEFADGHVGIVDMCRGPVALTPGDLAGNRFEIKVRDVAGTEVVRAKRIVDHLARHGAANFLGDQRFGYRLNNHEQGRRLITGDLQGFLDVMLGEPRDDDNEHNRAARSAYEAGDYAAALEAWPTVHRFERQAIGPLSRGASAAEAVSSIDLLQRRMLVTAWQSAIFNRVLDARVRAGRLHVMELGDLAFKHTTRGVFQVRDLAAEQPRCDAFEISATGPMWGPDMRRASGDVDTRELDALAESGVSLERVMELAGDDYEPRSSRRAMRMQVYDPLVTGGADEFGPFVKVEFGLPRGCFATTVMREVMKSGVGG